MSKVAISGRAAELRGGDNGAADLAISIAFPMVVSSDGGGQTKSTVFFRNHVT